ncbi:MAG: hypothetical protein ACE14P_14900 [Methanotrichaceae archaeon]
MKIMLGILFALAIIVGIAAGAEYSHRYSTYEISFSTPPGVTADVQWGDEANTGINGTNNGTANETNSLVGKLITVNLCTGDSLFILPHSLSTWEPRDTSRDSLQKLWNHDADGTLFTNPNIYRLDNGDYIATGHMMRAGKYITRTLRTYDFNYDDRTDFYVLWNANGKEDMDLMNSLATGTKIKVFEG